MQPEFEKYLQQNLDELDTRQPDPALLQKVLAQMKPVEQPAKKGLLIPFRVVWWAAASVVIAIATIMVWPTAKPVDNLVKNTTVQETTPTPLPQDKMVVQPAPAMDSIKNQRAGMEAVNKDLAERKQKLARDLGNHHVAVFAGFNKMGSAAERINAVTAAANLSNAGNDIVNGLVQVLDKDPNTNVKLAALDGLAGFYRDNYTRKKLLASLKKQTDPVVQIALINLLARMRESSIMTTLETMVKDQRTEKNVKDCAYSAILQLKI